MRRMRHVPSIPLRKTIYLSPFPVVYILDVPCITGRIGLNGRSVAIDRLNESITRMIIIIIIIRMASIYLHQEENIVLWYLRYSSAFSSLVGV